MTHERSASVSSGTRLPRRWWWAGGCLFLVLLLGIGFLVRAGRSAGDDDVLASRASASADEPRRAGENWPRFLGPRGTGVSGETGILEDWPADGPPVLWAKEVGTGYSAPSVRGNRLVLHHRRGNEEIIDCLRADTGERLWRSSYESRFRDPYGYNNGPRCTPLLTEKRCYTFGAEGKLVCTDLQTGERIWMRDTQQDFDVPQGFFGVGCTPILEGGRLIVLVGGQPNSGVVALDAGTGKTLWENVGRETWNGVETGNGPYRWTGEEMLVSYSSPFAATIHGKRHVLCLMRQGLVSVDPRDGRVNFKYWFRSRKRESVNAARPVVIGDKIFLSAAYQVGSALLQVDEDGRGYEELWRRRRNMQAHWSTPIHVDGYLYGFSGRHESEAEFRCLDVETGDVAWRADGSEPVADRVRFDATTGRFVDRQSGNPVPHPFYGRGSMIKVEDRFIVLGERGTLALVEIDSDKLRERARTSYEQIHYPSWTAPVLSRKRLYLRCEDALICLDVAQKRKAGNPSP